MGAVILAVRAWLAERKKPAAMLLAERKRSLESLLLAEGLSHSKARRVVAQFFKGGSL